MSLKEVQEAVDHIAAIADDDESAHGYEDSLYSAILTDIADGTLAGDEARECAELALTTNDINFSRWCA